MPRRNAASRRRSGYYGGRGPGLALSVLAAGFLLAGGGLLTVTGGDVSVKSPASAAYRGSGPAASRSPLERVTDPSRVPAALPTTVTLLEPPADVTWEPFVGVPLPYSPTAGPGRVAGPVVSGFARSPEGALLAAAHLGVRYLLTPGDGWRQVVERQVLPGPGREFYREVRGELVADDPPGVFGQLAGFRLVTFAPEVAVLQLVTRFPRTGTLQVTVTTVKWVQGDWRLELQPDGGTSPTAQSVPSLDGFVVWGAA